MTRKQNSFNSLITGVIGHFFVILFQFMCRTVFVKCLSNEYLGINGLFTNILTVLSLSELGIGTAMMYSLYKPIYNNDEDDIIKLLNLYRLLYRYIAFITFILGIALMPFLDDLIKGGDKPDNIMFIYLLYLINSVVSYLLVYKKSIIEANQKMYICNIYQKGLTVLQNIAQMIFLLLTRNFYIYLLIQIFTSILINFIISRKADRMYPFINTNHRIYPNSMQKKQIISNASSITMNKVGGIIASSTDNIILTKFVSLAITGLYSNYYLLINNISVFINLALLSFTASLGSLGASENKERLYEVFQIINFYSFWIYSMTTIMLLFLINPFIDIWLGKTYCLDQSVVALILSIFFLSGLRRVPSIFREALGIYRPDRYKALLEGLLNLLFSLYFVQKYGISGVFIGTILSILLVIWYDIYILYKHGFNKKASSYITWCFKNIIIMILITCILCLFENSFHLSFITRLISYFFLYNGIFIIFHVRNHSMQSGVKFLLQTIAKIKIKRKCR